jgi:GNAT superfamily N-acetyltransferase
MHEETDQARVAKLGDVPAEDFVVAMTEIDDIFFKSSSVQSFARDEEKARFRERWLGRYLTHHTAWAYVARDADGHVVGYIVGAIDDPAQNPRYADIPYFVPWSHLTAEYPAHLHINVAPEWRGGGLGARLIAAFAHDAAAAGAAGLHVVTGEGMRNVGFYLRNGFQQLATLSQKGKGVVFLGRRLR